MRIPIGVWRGIGAASALALLLAACSPRLDGPAPVIGSAPAQQPSTITVQRGQTLSGIAHTYHVPMSAVAEANHLSPPYRIEAGRALPPPPLRLPSLRCRRHRPLQPRRRRRPCQRSLRRPKNPSRPRQSPLRRRLRPQPRNLPDRQPHRRLRRTAAPSPGRSAAAFWRATALVRTARTTTASTSPLRAAPPCKLRIRASWLTPATSC